MLFTDEFCCKCDVVDKQNGGRQIEAKKVENTHDKRHRVLRSSKSKLILMKSWDWRGRTKKVSDKPNIVEVVICRKHNNNEILQALQIGIRQFSGQYLPKKELLPLDFRSSQCTCNIQYSELNCKSLTQSTVTDFEWKDYSPALFRHLQVLGNIKYADYMLSVCGHETLTEISSPGKSGSLFYKSKDGRFVIKTLRKSEVKVLCEMLPDYLRHIRQYKTSLLVMLYGLHAVRPVGGQKVYFVVMANVLQSDLTMHRFYDLKGSSQGRTIGKADHEHEGTIFKDLDIDFQFFLKSSTRHQLLVQIKNDCKFLEARGIMDYSLLLGVHIEPPNKGVKITTDHCSFQNYKKFEWDFTDGFQKSGRVGAKFGLRVPARIVRLPRNGKHGNMLNQTSTGTEESYDAILHIGIIDILQGYNVKKRIEHAYKSVQYDSRTISAVNPKVYSARFQDFLSQVFQAEESAL